jgi:Tfp pilus assembly protein PilO
MSMTRRWSLMATVLIVGILAASWFLLVAPKRSQAADLRGQSTEQQATNAGLILKLNELKTQSLDLPKQKAQLAVMRKQIPDNPALPTLIRSLTDAGKKVGVTLLSMKPGTPAAAVVATSVAVVPAPATTTSGTDTTTSGGTSAAGTTPTAAAPVAAPLYVVPLGLEITGSYFEVEQFINKLEGMQRNFLLTGFTLKPSTTATSSADQMDLTLNGQVFLAPNVASATTTPVTAPAAAQAQ